MMGEYFRFNMIATLFVLIVTFVFGFNMGFTPAGWEMFFIWFVFSVVLGSVAWFYLNIRKNDAIGHTCMAYLSMSILLGPLFMYSYMMLRAGGGFIDPYLARFDELIGLDWPAFLNFAAKHPDAMPYLQTVYNSHALIIPVTFTAIGFFKEMPERSHEFVTNVLISCVIVCTIGGLWPANGPYVFYGITDPLLALVDPVIDPHMMDEIHKIRSGVENGFDYGGGIGVVTFPSFHLTLSVMLIWFARGTGWLFGFLTVWNLAIIAFTPIMGNHYLADLAGGIIVSAFTIWVTTRLYQWLDQRAPEKREAVGTMVAAE